MRLHPILPVLLLPGLLAAQTGRRPVPDPIDGVWTGTAGAAPDLVPIVFRFAHDSAGALTLNASWFAYYDTEVPGPIVRRGDTITTAALGISLRRTGDSLTGVMFSNQLPVRLRRGGTVPGETSVPRFGAAPDPLWRTKLGGAIYGPAALRDGVVYVGTTAGYVDAVALADGSFRWAAPLGSAVYGGVLSTADALYVAADAGWLFRLDPATGHEVWRYDLGGARAPRIGVHLVIENSGEFDWDVMGPTPVLAGGVLYVGSGDGALHAVRAADGTRVWVSAAGAAPVRGDAAVDADRVYFGDRAGILHAVRRADGVEVWRRDLRSALVNGVALIDGTVIAGSRYGYFGGFDPISGEPRWRSPMWGSAQESMAAPAGAGRFVVGSSDLRRVSLMDAQDGTARWRTDVYGWPWARPTVAGDRVYMGVVGTDPYEIRHLGSLTVMELATGRIRWRWEMPAWPGAIISGFNAPPTVGEGHIVVGGVDGTLYAFPDR